MRGLWGKLTDGVFFCSNCLDGTDRYYDWEGWSDPDNSLTRRWGAAVRYHVGFKWLWLNGGTNDTLLISETVHNGKFYDELYQEAIAAKQAQPHVYA